MELLQSIILGIVQGLTEFLPVSSSGHLALVQNYFGNVNVNLDVLLHLATLLAVVCYFFRDILGLIKGFFSFSWKNEDFRMCIYLFIATIPAGIAGFLLRNIVYNSFSNFLIIGIGFFISGMLLLVSSVKSQQNKKISLANAVIIGISQALAVFPGISRSGSTTSAGILLGLQREKAVRFSFLLAIPVILGAVLLNLPDIQGLDIFSGLLGFIFAFAFGILGIFLFLKRVSLKSFRWFAFYCFILGILSLVLYFL